MLLFIYSYERLPRTLRSTHTYAHAKKHTHTPWHNCEVHKQSFNHSKTHIHTLLGRNRKSHKQQRLVNSLNCQSFVQKSRLPWGSFLKISSMATGSVFVAKELYDKVKYVFFFLEVWQVSFEKKWYLCISGNLLHDTGLFGKSEKTYRKVWYVSYRSLLEMW